MKYTYFIACVILLFISVRVYASNPLHEVDQKRGPSHSDAAIILAKHSGLFDKYLSRDATLSDCVSFLNEHGIYFGLMEVVNRTEFTAKDCARVMGQIELIFTGEAEFLIGKVILPKGIDSWEAFCTMEGVEYIQGYKAIVQALYMAQALDR
jgi:hypothetical protein